MKAARQDMHKNMLGLKHLQQESDEEHKSRENPRHERASQEQAKCKSREVQKHVRHVRHENM